MTLLNMRDISKRFGPVTVLKGVNFDLEAGEVHALVGENGAGKSTLMKILAGVQPFDEGSMQLSGETVRFANVSEARERGVVMVYQELALVPSLSVAENLFLGALPTWVNYRGLQQRAKDALADVELDVDPRSEVGKLSIGEQQLIEIARALAKQSRILILDEPTAALSAAESERLFEIIAKVKTTGVSMVYISHRLEEVFRIADRVTVLRDGAWVGTKVTAEVRPDDIVEMMVGRSVRHYERGSKRVEDVRADFQAQSDGLEEINITLHKGEIIGLAGVIGSGRERVLPTLFGLEGTAEMNGERVTSPRAAIAKNMFLVPSDRKTQGLVLELAVRENIGLATFERLQQLGFVQRGAERHQAQTWIDRLSLRPPEPKKQVRELSGGNQQKVVIAKALATEPEVLLLDEPTRGVDIGARSELYDVIDDLAAQGLGLIVSSSDSEELISLADRILVFRQGRVTAELTAPFAYEEVVAHVTGALTVA